MHTAQHERTSAKEILRGSGGLQRVIKGATWRSVEVTVAAFRATGVGPWYHQETTSLMDVDVRVKYTQRIMTGPARKKF